MLTGCIYFQTLYSVQILTSKLILTVCHSVQSYSIPKDQGIAYVLNLLLYIMCCCFFVLSFFFCTVFLWHQVFQSKQIIYIVLGDYFYLIIYLFAELYALKNLITLIKPLQRLVSKIKLVTMVEITRRLPFQQLLHPSVGEGATPFPELLLFTFDPYLIMLSVKQGSIKEHF